MSPGTTLLGGDAHLPPVAQHRRAGRGHPLERRDRLLGPAFLQEAEHGIGNDDDGDHERLERHAGGVLQRPGTNEMTTAASSR